MAHPHILDKLQEILCQASSNTQSLATASEEISASTRDQAKGAESQRDQTTQVAAAMQQMGVYGGGMATCSHLQEMQELETRHKEMHASVKHVVELKHAGRASEAEQEFSRVCEAADRVVGLITRVEAQVVGARAHAVEGVKPRAAAQATLN